MYTSCSSMSICESVLIAAAKSMSSNSVRCVIEKLHAIDKLHVILHVIEQLS